MISLRAGSATDVGLVRSNNQDSFLVADPLYAVADGMGGAAAGEVASAIAVESLNNGFSRSGPPTPDLLVEAAQAANRAVWDEALANPEMRGMGTTLVAVALVEGPEIAVINIGDSRAYQFHDGDLRQVTVDHNLVAEMEAQGRITKEEAEVHPRRNIMTRALGVEPEVPVDLFMEDPSVGDRYLLCSDGLPREVKDDLIASLLRRIGDPGEVARELVEEAKRRGGNDNITVVVVDVVDAGAAAEEATVVTDALSGAAAADPTSAGPEAAVAGTDAEATQAQPVSAADPTATMALPIVKDTPPPAGPSEEAPDKKRRLRRQRPGGSRPKRRAITARVVVFIVLLLVILAAGAAGVVWYARSTYFVAVQGNQISIFKGRPGGVLWFKPTLAQRTGYPTSQVLNSDLSAIGTGKEEPSLSAAQAYVQTLKGDWTSANPPPTTTTTAPTTTTPPTTRPPATAPPTTKPAP